MSSVVRSLALVATFALAGCFGSSDDRSMAPSPVPAAENNAAKPSPSVFDAPPVTIDQVLAARDQGEDLLLVDVRSKESFQFEHIKGAVSYPWADMANIHSQIPKKHKLVLYCA